MKRILTLPVIIALFILSGCAVKKAVTAPYRALYCESKAPDGSCEIWAPNKGSESQSLDGPLGPDIR